MIANMPDNEGKGMHQSTNEERIPDPAMEYLQLFMRHSGHERDPVGFSRRGTINRQQY